MFTGEASTSSWDKLLQWLTARCEKNWRRALQIYNDSDSLTVSSCDLWLQYSQICKGIHAMGWQKNL